VSKELLEKLKQKENFISSFTLSPPTDDAKKKKKRLHSTTRSSRIVPSMRHQKGLNWCFRFLGTILTEISSLNGKDVE
jgi:hypothetical protein